MIRIEDAYTNSNPADGNYPDGSFKNSTTPTLLDGTPLEKAWPNDIQGFFQKLLNDWSITPSGVAETILNSDLFDALSLYLGHPLYALTTGTSTAYLATIKENITAYSDGLRVVVRAHVANGLDPTIDVNGLGARDISLPDGSFTPAGAWGADEQLVLIYNSVLGDFVWINSTRVHNHSNVLNGGFAKGQIVQSLITETGAVSTGATSFEATDAIPVKTDGDEYMQRIITPTSVNNKLLVDALWNGAHSSAGGGHLMALFQDDITNGLKACMGAKATTVNAFVQIYLHFEMIAGTVSPTTFKIRSGAPGAGTTTFNGVAGGRIMGGFMGSFLWVREEQV